VIVIQSVFMSVSGNKLDSCFLPYWEMHEAKCKQELDDLSNWNMVITVFQSRVIPLWCSSRGNVRLPV